MADASEEGPQKQGIAGCCFRFVLFMRCYWKSLVIIIVPLISLLVFLIPTDTLKDIRCLYIVCIMFIYWITVAIPLPMTALIPVVLLPSLGITKVQHSCMAYLKEANLIFLGVFLLSVAIDTSRVYVRFALKWMLLIGCSHCRLTFGIFSATAFASMWLSSTVATALTVPILITLLKSLEDEGLCRFSLSKDPNDEKSAPAPTKTTTCYLLGVAYSANIGGTATLIGSCVNLATRDLIDDFFLYKPLYIQFQRWMAACIIPMIVELVIVWLWLNAYFMGMFWKTGCDPEIKDQHMEEGKEKHKKVAETIHNSLQKQYSELGPVKWSEIIVTILLFLLIIMWVLRDPVFFSGWEKSLQSYFPPIMSGKRDIHIRDASALVIVLVCLVAIPSTLDFIHFFSYDDENRPKSPGPALIAFKPTSKIFPWAIFFIIGGGFSIFRGIRDSELLKRLDVEKFRNINHELLLLLVCCVTIILTQFIDSAALFFILAPVFAELCKLSGVKCFYIMVALGVCCSFGFIFPWRTPPNEIVYEKAKIPIKNMMIAGIVPLVVSLVLTVVTFMFLGKMVLEGLVDA